MLHEFLTTHREALIESCREKVLERASPAFRPSGIDHGVPYFLDQLIETLAIEQGAEPLESRRVSGPAGGEGNSEMGDTAAQHGAELMQLGYTVEHVVHDYGDLCQSITDLAFALDAPVAVDEFRTLNRCLDNAIALAVSAFNHQRDFAMAGRYERELNEKIGFLAHELRNYLYTASLALYAITDGNLGIGGATGTVLNRALVGMRGLIDRTLADVLMTARLTLSQERFSLADFIAEMKSSAALEARLKGCQFTVEEVDRGLAMEGDRDLLLAALGNLLQNAFKFTRPGTEVVLRAYAKGLRILIEVEDHGEGLREEDAERLFLPFQQAGEDQTGLGLGLAISRRSVDAHGGILRVRTKPESGCIFTIDLPRQAMPEVAS